MNAFEQIKTQDTQSVAERRSRMPPIPDDFHQLITH